MDAITIGLLVIAFLMVCAVALILRRIAHQKREMESLELELRLLHATSRAKTNKGYGPEIDRMLLRVMDSQN